MMLNSEPVGTATTYIDKISFMVFTGSEFSSNYKFKSSSQIIDESIFLHKFIKLFRKMFSYLIEKDYSCSAQSLYRYHSLLKGGFDLQMCPRFAIRKLRLDDSFDVDDLSPKKEYDYIDSDFGIRIEFNPSKCIFDYVKPFFSFLYEYFSAPYDISFDDFIKFSRVDVAVDYPRKMYPAFFTCGKKRKSVFFVSSRGIETVYFGSRSSDLFFRVYNKKLELEQVQGKKIFSDLWRVELEAKKRFTFSESYDHLITPFRDMKYYDFSGDQSALGVLLNYYARENGISDALSLFPPATKYRYKKIFSGEFKEISPYDVVKVQFPFLWKQFYESMRKSFKVPSSDISKRYKSVIE